MKLKNSIVSTRTHHIIGCVFGALLCMYYPGEALSDGTNLGLYLDAEGSIVCCPDTLMMHDAYLILNTSSQILGFQLRLEAESGIVISLNTYGGNAVDVGNWPEIIAGFYPSLRPIKDSIILATFSVYPYVSGNIFIDNLESTGSPFGIVDEFGTFFVPYLKYGGVDLPVLAFGQAPCPEESVPHSVPGAPEPESNTWGGVKNLYSGGLE